MEAVDAKEISDVQGQKMQPRVVKDDYTGLTVTLRHMPMRVYLHCQQVARMAVKELDESDRPFQKMCHEAQLYAMFAVKEIDGLESPAWEDVEIDGVQFPCMTKRTVDQIPAGVLLELRKAIIDYNMLSIEEAKKLNFTSA